MPINQSLIAELQHEGLGTRKLLERVKEDTYSYQPHEKSMTLLKLASHVAEIPSWLEPTVQLGEMDFAKMDYKPPVVQNNKDLLDLFDNSLKIGVEALKKADDANLMETWTAKNNGAVVFAMPRVQVVRSMIMNHLVHHRAQLGVYLRMTDVPLPSIYGPTADEH
jgi:uncharacterized damage-inducible protein DinB